MTCLLIHLEGPLMSFGGTVVDQFHPTHDWPLRSQITGLLANALGYEHHQHEALSHLQSRLRMAVREDRRGRPLRDYQTVDLGQEHLVARGWTTRGVREDRGKGSATTGTHIRYRHYLANAAYTVAIRLEPANEDPDLGHVADALAHPARPLFIGRKSCVPSAPLVLPTERSGSRSASFSSHDNEVDALLADVPPTAERLWHQDPMRGAHHETLERTESRDWLAQMHTGREHWWVTTCTKESAHA